MAITQISYARLHNLGNYENERFEVVVTVEEGDVAGAFAEARAATDAARIQVEGERRAEADRIQQEQEALRLQRRQDRIAQEQRQQAQPDLDF